MIIFTASTPHSLEKTTNKTNHNLATSVRFAPFFIYIWPFAWINRSFRQKWLGSPPSRLRIVSSCVIATHRKNMGMVLSPKTMGRLEFSYYQRQGWIVGICSSNWIISQSFGVNIFHRPAHTTWKINILNPKNGGLVLRSNDLQSWKASPSFSRMASDMYWGLKRGVQTPVL